MGILSAITDFVGGNIFKEAKDLIREYLPPDLSPEKAQEFETRWAELQAKKSLEAGKLANETLSLELADVQDARKNHNQSKVPAWIVGATTAIVIGVYASLIFIDIPAQNRELLIQLNGVIQGVWLSAVSYFVGTTRSSSIKTDIISRAQ